MGGPETILVVEDMDIVRVMIGTALKANGYEVLTAGSSAEAFELASGREIDLLMTDLSMPGLGGLEVAKRLVESHPKLRVIFTSGYSADEETERAIEQTNGAFLRKPFVLEELALTVRKLLDRKNGDAPVQ